MLNMLQVDICAYGFSGLGTGICALFTQILYGALELICKLLGTFVDLLNIAFFIFAGIDYDNGRFNIIKDSTGESMNILDYFIFDAEVTKAYLGLAVIALVLVVIFTIYKIVKQDYFDRAGPRSKGPIFRNVAISCISFILVIPIFYLIIHASSLLAVQVMSAMGMAPDKYAGLRIFELSWSDAGVAMHTVNNALAKKPDNIGTMWYLESNIFFVMLADGDLVRYDTDTLNALHLDPWKGPLSTYSKSVTVNGQTYENSVFYANFYWYIYIVGIFVALKAMWNLILAMIQRIFKLLGLFLVAPAPISQYVLDDGAKYKEWLKKSIEEGLRLVVAVMSFSIFLLALGAISDIDFSSAFARSMTAASGGRAEGIANVSASTLVYGGEFANIPTLNNASLLVSDGDWDIYEGVKSYENFGDYLTVSFGWTGIPGLVEKIGASIDSIKAGCGLNGVRIVAGKAVCNLSFFARLINAFLQCLLVVAAGGAIKDLDTVLSPLISGAQSSLDSGNTGGAVNAVGKAAVAVAGAVAGGVVSGVAGAVKNKGAAEKGAEKGAEEEAEDAASASAPEEGSGPSAPTDGGGGGSGGSGGDSQTEETANAPTEGNGGEGETQEETTETPETQEGETQEETTETPETQEGDQSQAEGETQEETTETPQAQEGDQSQAEGETQDKKDEGTETPESGDKKQEGEDGDKKADGQDGDKKAEGQDGDKKAEGQGGDKKDGGQGGDKKPGNAGDKKPGNAGDKKSSGADKSKKQSKIGKALKGAGKLAMRVGKSTPVSVAFGGMKRGLLAGLKSAGMQLASAYGLDGAVKGFKDAKKESDEKETEAAKKKYEKARNNAFMTKRKERVEQANNKANAANENYAQAATKVDQAVATENAATNGLNTAEVDLMRAEAEASAANSGVLAGDKKLEEAQTQVAEHDALVQTARNDNKVILDSAGVSSYDELDSKISLLPKGSEERDKLEQLRDKYVPESTISQWQAQADAGRETIAKRERMADTMTGRNGMLDKIGVGPNATFAEVKSAAKTKAKEADATIKKLEDIQKDRELNATEKKQLAEAKSITQLNDDLKSADKADETYFGRETVKEAREKNRALNEARASRDQAKRTYDEAHGATEAARSEMNGAKETYDQQKTLATKLTTSAGFNKNFNDTTFGVDEKGNVTGRDLGVNSRRKKGRQALGMLSPGQKAEKITSLEDAIATEKNKKKPNQKRIEKLNDQLDEARMQGIRDFQNISVSSASSPQTVARVYESCEKTIESRYANAGKTFESGTAPNGQPMSEVLKGCKMATRDGQYNIPKVKELLKSDKIDDKTKEVITEKLVTYERATKDYHEQNRAMGNMRATSHSMKTIDQRIEANAARGQVLANEANVMQQVIASGGNVQLTPQMTRIMNSIPGAHITTNSSPSEILAAAKNARHQRVAEQATIATETQNLKAQSDQLANSLKGVLGNLANELAGRRQAQQPQPQAQQPQPQAQQPQPQAQQPQPSISIDPVNFTSQIKSPDQMNESMYERMQTEMLRSNQEILNRVREQNKDILDTVERVEDEVKGD